MFAQSSHKDLCTNAIALSMDGRGRALDNVFIERLWRSLKYELIDPGDCQSGTVLFAALTDYFDVYNYQPPHQALDYRTPADLFPHPHKRKSLPCWGTLSPHPLGFSLSARLADFSLANVRTLHRMAMLARRIELSREGTRAPRQVQAGGG